MTPDELAEAPPVKLDVPVCRATGPDVEIRAADEDAGMPTMAGHFSMFGNWYEINSFWEGRFLERIAKGAFKKTLAERADKIRVLLEHGFDPTVGDKPLGVPSRMKEDAEGAAYEVPLFDTSYNRDLVPALEAGAYGSSFRFEVLVDEWNNEPGRTAANPEGIPERTIKEVRVIEFGPTVFPANPEATAGLRSTTDRYYDKLRTRNAEQYEAALRSVRDLRTPNERTPEPAAAGTGVEERSEGAATAPSDEPREHSEAPNPQEQTRSKTMSETMTVEERAARQSEIRARLAEIDNEHSGAALPDEVRSEWDGLEDEYRRHDEAIKEQERRRDTLRALTGQTGSTERGSEPAPVTRSVRRPENIYDLAEIRSQARSIDELPQLYRDNALRAVEQARFHGVEADAARANVERLLDTVDDEQGNIARRILVTGSPQYLRAFGKVATKLNDAGLTAEEQRALSVGVDNAGGYAVPFQLDPTVVLTNDGRANPLRQISRVVQIAGDEWKGITSAGITVTRAAEAAEADDNSPTLEQPTAKPTRVQGFVPYSIELDQDWNALQSEIMTMLADAKDEEESVSFVTGSGTGNNPEGLLTGATVTVAGTAGGAVSAAKLYELEEDLPERFRQNAQFVGARSAYNRVRQLDTNGGANLWVRLGAGLPPELIGYPAHVLSTVPSGSGTSEKYLVLGDFRHFLIIDRVGMSVELVPHLFGANRRPTGQRGLYAIWRNTSKVLVPNAFRALVTPAV